jgi:hypothetical protein
MNCLEVLLLLAQVDDKSKKVHVKGRPGGGMLLSSHVFLLSSAGWGDDEDDQPAVGKGSTTTGPKPAQTAPHMKVAPSIGTDGMKGQSASSPPGSKIALWFFDVYL